MDLGMGTGACGGSTALVSSTVSLSQGTVCKLLGGSGTGTKEGTGAEEGTGAGAETGTGIETGIGTGIETGTEAETTEGEGPERYPAVRGSLPVMVTIETAGITGGEKTGGTASALHSSEVGEAGDSTTRESSPSAADIGFLSGKGAAQGGFSSCSFFGSSFLSVLASGSSPAQI